jgi:hypothetical protein
MNTNNIDKLRERFCKLLLSTERTNTGAVLTELRRLGFFEAPASRSGHCCYAGGLVSHSLNVYEIARRLAKDINSMRTDILIKEDSLIITTLLHDISKATRYRLTNGIYEKNYDFPIGHGEKSVIMLLRLGLELTDEEAVSIRFHMGPWQLALHNEEMTEDYKQACKSPLTALLYTADTIAAQIIENT